MAATDKAMSKMRDAAAVLGEHFSDFILVVRVKDGLNWRMSDRTFALGACKRLMKRLDTEDELSLKERDMEDL